MKLYRPREIAKLFGLAKSTVYGMINRGEFPVVRFNGTVRIPEDGLRRWIEERTTAPREAVG